MNSTNPIIYYTSHADKVLSKRGIEKHKVKNPAASYGACRKPFNHILRSFTKEDPAVNRAKLSLKIQNKKDPILQQPAIIKKGSLD